MILTRKTQVNPSHFTQNTLWSISHCCVDLWNISNEQRQYRSGFGKVNIYSQKKELTQLKKENESFKLPSSQVLQNVLFALDRSYKMFFTKLKKGDKHVKRPKFKSKKYFFTQEYSQYGTSFVIEDNIIKLAYGKNKKDWLEIPFKDSRKLPNEKIKTLELYQDHMTKKWYVSITYEFKEIRYQKNQNSIYFDPGCKTSLTGITSNGEFFEYDINPLRKLNKSTYLFIDKLMSQRDLIKNKKSKRHVYNRLNKRIKKAFRKINTRSKMYLHTLANEILKDHPNINQFMIGDWKKQETLANEESLFVNKRINRAVQNNNPLQKLIECLSYKAKAIGKIVKKFNERGSTRTCSQCGKQHSKGINPNKRTFHCVDTKNCGFQYSRDHQSCLNFIKKFESALWRCLVDKDNLPTRSKHKTLSPFACKTQSYRYQL